MINDENIYDPNIYTDYYDLPNATKKRLFAEWQDLNRPERTTLRIIRGVSLASILAVISLLVAALVVSIIYGICVPLIIISGTAILFLGVYVVFTLKSEKIRVGILRKYADWLRKEKHVIATLKIDMK